MAYKKVIRKVVRKAGRALKRRYFKGKGYSNPKLGQMASDVLMLKKLVNAEKKHTTIQANGNGIGQVNVNVSGFYAVDLTPVPSAGVSEIQRTGTSIKLVSSHMRFQFVGQQNSINRTKFKIMLIENQGERVTNVTNWVNDRFVANPFIGGGSIIDLNSSFNQNTFGGFRIIRTKTFTMKPDNVSGEQNQITFPLGIKYNRGKGTHIRYQTGTSTPANKQIFMVVMADTGNWGATNSTLSNVPQPGNLTGYSFNYYARHYYIDN